MIEGILPNGDYNVIVCVFITLYCYVGSVLDDLAMLHIIHRINNIDGIVEEFLVRQPTRTM